MLFVLVKVFRSPATPFGNRALVLLISHQISFELESVRDTVVPERSISDVTIALPDKKTASKLVRAVKLVALVEKSGTRFVVVPLDEKIRFPRKRYGFVFEPKT